MGMICCDSFTTDGSGDATVTTPQWEPQMVMCKPSSDTGNWDTYDMMRGTVTGGNDSVLSPNLSSAEVTSSDHIAFTALGFEVTGYQASTTYIYMCIRRPMKTPESSSECFAIDTRGSVDSDEPGFRSGFPIDMAFRRETSIDNALLSTRLTQGKYIQPSETDAEATNAAFVFDYMSGWSSNTGTNANMPSWMWKRAPGFMDVVCYAGDGQAGREVEHNLGVVPEMMWVKARTQAAGWAWVVYHKNLTATDNLYLNYDYATQTYIGMWNDTEPVDTIFTLGSDNYVNSNTYTYIAFLFCTLPGISKVGSYTGNGSTQNLDMGFASGAKMVIFKATSTTGNWVMVDSERGIVSGSDPYLLLNSTAAEDTDEDCVDSYAAGITINETTAANINTNEVEYIYYAVSL